MQSMAPYQRRIILALVAVILAGLGLKLVDRERQAIQFDIKGFLDSYKYTTEIDTLMSPIKTSSNAPIQPTEIQMGDRLDIAAIGKVNINIADIKLIQNLPGIGPVLAKRIVDYRDSVGHFEKLDDLLAVPGIGDKKLSQIEPFLVF